jgi:hypothetical protein
MPIVNQGGTDYTAIARGAGIQQAITVDDLPEFLGILQGGLAIDGHDESP